MIVPLATDEGKRWGRAGLANRLSKFLGQRGLLAMEKLMGMILITISVQMIMTGLKKFIGS
jgi:multiple antibiotic resistance protein